MKNCDFETSKALQELGYDGECNKWYDRDGNIKSTHLVDDDAPAPRIDDVAYWLGDRQGIPVWAEYQPPFACWNPYLCDTSDTTDGYRGYAKSCDKYEDALECAVKKAIETIKERQQ